MPILTQPLRQMSRFFSPRTLSAHYAFKGASEKFFAFSPEHQIQLVQSDVAGTLVDPYCLAPLNAFNNLFSRRQFQLTHAQITGPMGLKKIDHIKHLLSEISSIWQQRYGHVPNDKDAEELHDEVMRELNASVAHFSDLTPHADVAIDFLRRHSIPLALTTGYSRQTATLALSKLNQYAVSTTADEVPNGTRFEMIAANMRKLCLPFSEMKRVVFITDAVSDVESIRKAAGLNGALNVWTFCISDYCTGIEGITSQKQAASISAAELFEKRKRAKERLLASNPHAVLKDLSELPHAIVAACQALSENKTPEGTPSLVIKTPSDEQNSANDFRL